MNRPATMLVLAVALGLSAGCAVGVAPDRPKPLQSCIGVEAADIARARAREYAEGIEMLRGRYEETASERERLIEDAAAYRAKAAKARRGPGYSDSERGPYSEQYSTLAAERTEQASCCAELMNRYKESITVLENKRLQMLRQAERLDRLKVPRPS